MKFTLILDTVCGGVDCVHSERCLPDESLYGITANGRRCEQNATDNQTMAVVSTVDHEYIFTTVVYGVLSVLRIVEYLLLGQQFYYFLFKQKVINAAPRDIGICWGFQ